MTQQQRFKVDFKSPEGEYRLHCERPSRAMFSNTRLCRMTLASLPADPEGSDPGGLFVIYSAADFLYITEYTTPDREPLRSIYCGTGPGGAATYATAHTHAAAADGVDLLIGLNTGDVLATSLAGQLQAQRGDGRRQASLHFNINGVADTSRVAGLAWLPGSNGVFVVGHASGTIFFYQKKRPGLSGAQAPTQLKSIVSVPGPDAFASISTGSSINALAASPDGASLAVACADGVLRVYDTATRRLTSGFKSYSGGLLCCAWSPDGSLIAAGGEDDLVCLYSLEERAVVAWGGGHTSWVSALAFDPMAHQGQPDTEGLVRLVTGGQDAQMALWDFDLSPAALAPVSPRGFGAAAGASRQLSFLSDSKANGTVADASAAASAPVGVITPAAPHADMDIQPPVRIRKLHSEPVSAVLPTPGALFLGSHSGVIRCWRRPRPLPPAPSPEEPQSGVEGDVAEGRLAGAYV